MAAPNTCEPCTCGDFLALTGSWNNAAAGIMAILCSILDASIAAQSCDCVLDDSATTAETTGSIVAGVDDNGDAQFLHTDTSGNLQVAVASLAASTAVQNLVSLGAASGPVLAANPLRMGGWITNISTNEVYIAFAATAFTNKPTRLTPGSSLPLLTNGLVYTGIVTGITGGTTDSVEVTELTA